MNIRIQPLTAPSLSMEKIFISSKARIIRIFYSNKSFSRRLKKPQISRRRFCLTRAWRNSRYFNPMCWATDSIFFRLESADSMTEKISTCLEPMTLMAVSKSDFIRFLVFSMRFIKNGQIQKPANTIIFNKQIPKSTNRRAHQNVHNVNKYHRLVRQCTILRDNQNWLFYSQNKET